MPLDRRFAKTAMNRLHTGDPGQYRVKYSASDDGPLIGDSNYRLIEYYLSHHIKQVVINILSSSLCGCPFFQLGKIKILAYLAAGFYQKFATSLSMSKDS